MTQFRILGSLEAECGGRLVPLGWPYERRVLAALLVDAGRVVPVPQLVDAAWDDPPATARKQVQNAVSRLRRALGDAGGHGLIMTATGGYRLDLSRCTVDARVFEAEVAAAGRAAAEGKAAEAAGLLRSALGLWRGPALAGLAGRWLEPAAAGWEEHRLAALEMRCELELALGQHREILGELTSLAAGNPLREKLAGLHMLALYRCGRQAEALSAYKATRELLASQLGLDPGPELQSLHQQILTASPALALTEPARPADAEPPRTVLRVRFSLPPDTAAFTGRDSELSAITATVAAAGTECCGESGRAAPAIGGAAEGGVAAMVCAISGMPGAGKTALAVHVAHQLAAQFPDGRLFIDLQAHAPEQEPVKAVDALASLLVATGADVRSLPGDLNERAALWRDRMAGQRLLLVLDNAASSSQVTPLLPGTGGCLVLVTSRRHLGDLPGVVTAVQVDVLPAEEAADMFTRLAPRGQADPDGVAELAELAGLLPLAISLLARMLIRHPSWTIGDLIAETRARFLTLTAEHRSVAAAFEVSYQDLDPVLQRFFRLMSLHPDTETDAYAGAALAGIRVDEAAGHLDALYGEGLMTEAGYRRYGMHDLIRRFAGDLAATETSDVSQRALGRLLDYYQHTAVLANERVAIQTRPGPAPAVPPGIVVPDLDDDRQALAWVRAERASLLACLNLATRTGHHSRMIAFTGGLSSVLRHDGPLAEAVTRHARAAETAHKLGDRLGEANALADLGDARRRAGDFPGATIALGKALDIYCDLGSRLGEANARSELAFARHLMGADLPAVAAAQEQALSIYRDLGDRLGAAYLLGDLFVVRCQAGDTQGAVRLVEEALGIYRDLGHRLGEAGALRHLGYLRSVTGDFPGAGSVLAQALDVARGFGYPLGEAHGLYLLGLLRSETGDYAAAAEVLERAVTIWRDLGDRFGVATTATALGRLRRLTGDYPAAARALQDAVTIYRDIGGPSCQMRALRSLAAMRSLAGDYQAAAAFLEQALDLCRSIGERLDTADTLRDLGAARRLTHDHPGASDALDEALSIYRELGARRNEPETLNEQGTTQHARGNLDQAHRCHQQALDLARAIGNPHAEARALAGLSHRARTAGDTAEAEILLQHAYAISRRIGAAETSSILAQLNTLTPTLRPSGT